MPVSINKQNCLKTHTIKDSSPSRAATLLLATTEPGSLQNALLRVSDYGSKVIGYCLGLGSSWQSSKSKCQSRSRSSSRGGGGGGGGGRSRRRVGVGVRVGAGAVVGIAG